jgi:hypothetical protein
MMTVAVSSPEPEDLLASELMKLAGREAKAHRHNCALLYCERALDIYAALNNTTAAQGVQKRIAIIFIEKARGNLESSLRDRAAALINEAINQLLAAREGSGRTRRALNRAAAVTRV